jgi:ABC-type uncharacterized transport system permease subunit
MQAAAPIISIVLYTVSFAILLNATVNKSRAPVYFSISLALAIITHAWGLQLSMLPNSQLNLSIINAASMIFFAINTITFFSVLRKVPIDNLLLMLLPLTILCLFLSRLMPETALKTIQGQGLISHIILSILAYSFITIAALQASLLALQEKQLRQHNFTGVFQYLPPLQTLENLLFEMIWLGFITLTAAIISGSLFLHDIFAQHLAHKTVLSIIAWAVFAVLLIGRHVSGWRGTTATKWTLSGFMALMLAYFGSKFVLEILLSESWQT